MSSSASVINKQTYSDDAENALMYEVTTNTRTWVIYRVGPQNRGSHTIKFNCIFYLPEKEFEPKTIPCSFGKFDPNYGDYAVYLDDKFITKINQAAPGTTEFDKLQYTSFNFQYGFHKVRVQGIGNSYVFYKFTFWPSVKAKRKNVTEVTHSNFNDQIDEIGGTRAQTFFPGEKESRSRADNLLVYESSTLPFTYNIPLHVKNIGQGATFNCIFYLDTMTIPISKSTYPFSPSLEFTPSNTFAVNNEFIYSYTFSPSLEFTPSNAFAVNNKFTRSNKFSLNNIFTRTHEFTESATLVNNLHGDSNRDEDGNNIKDKNTDKNNYSEKIQRNQY